MKSTESKPSASTPLSVAAAVAAAMPVSGVSPIRLERVLESMREAEFDINHGLGEPMDNSVESGASNIWVFVNGEQKLFKGKKQEVVSQVAVVDDGHGMSKDVLQRCLVLGDTLRKPSPDGKKGIGRFGVGMTMGSISLGRRVEVFSRERPEDPFLYTVLSLDEFRDGQRITIPEPIEKKPPTNYAKLLEKSSGTVLVITECDRLQMHPVDAHRGIPATEQLKTLKAFVGRTYRKFIDAGRKFWLNGEPIYLHDPLYVMGPTFPDIQAGKPDPKAVIRGDDIIELEVPGQPGVMAKVKLTLTLLPKEWRPIQGSGISSVAKDRKIVDNEGVSILRADREVLYGVVPYILGVKGQAAAERIDRWWGLEISFPPELDEYFHVRYIKRGAEPIPALRDQIRTKIAPAIEALRKEIQSDFAATRAEEARKNGAFADAESTMADANKRLPQGKRASETTEADTDRSLDKIVQQDLSAPDAKSKEAKKEELKKKSFAIVPVNYPKNVFFETEHLLGRTIIKLNVAHPFYREVFEPLCGSVALMTEDSDIFDGANSEQKRRARTALALLLLSYGKAETFFKEPEQIEVTDNLRAQWGLALASAINAMES